MARWQDVVDSEPEFAQAVKARFDSHKHKLLATLRNDGSPRISGIETTFADGDIWLGMMPGSLKARDVQRDARFALHTSSEDPPEGDESNWSGDAKMAGRAVEEHDAAVRARVLNDTGSGGHPPDDVPLFRLDLSEVVRTRVGTGADHLLIESWHPHRPLQRTRRT